MSEITFLNFPLPPSENQLYKTILIKGFPRRAASQKLREFKEASHDWGVKHKYTLDRASNMMAKWLSQGIVIEIETIICLRPSTLFTKKGIAKRLDATNRVKALNDSLAELTGIDDKVYWRCSVEKAELDEEEQECAIITIRPCQMKLVKEITSKRLNEATTSSSANSQRV